MQSLKKHQQESRKLSTQIKNRDNRIAQLEGQRGQLEALAPSHSSQPPQRDGNNNVASDTPDVPGAVSVPGALDTPGVPGAVSVPGALDTPGVPSVPGVPDVSGDGGGQGVLIRKSKEKGKENKKSIKSSDRKRGKDCIDGGRKKEGKKGEVFNI